MQCLTPNKHILCVQASVSVPQSLDVVHHPLMIKILENQGKYWWLCDLTGEKKQTQLTRFCGIFPKGQEKNINCWVNLVLTHANEVFSTRPKINFLWISVLHTSLRLWNRHCLFIFLAPRCWTAHESAPHPTLHFPGLKLWHGREMPPMDIPCWLKYRNYIDLGFFNPGRRLGVGICLFKFPKVSWDVGLDNDNKNLKIYLGRHPSWASQKDLKISLIQVKSNSGRKPWLSSDEIQLRMAQFSQFWPLHTDKGFV